LPDTPNNENGNGTLRVRNIRADRQFSREMSVERLTVNTGDTKDAHSDMMEEVNSSVVDQTGSLSSKLDELVKLSSQQIEALKSIKTNEPRDTHEVRDHIDGLNKSIDGLKNAMVANTIHQQSHAAVSGGDDDGHDSNGTSKGDAIASAKLLKTAHGYTEAIAKKLRLDARQRKARMDDVNPASMLVITGVVEGIKANILDMVSSIQDVSKSLSNLSNVTDYVKDKFASGLDMAATGSISYASTLMPQMFRNGDNLNDTFNLVKSDGGIIGAIGQDLQAVSENIRDARLSLGGNSAVSHLNWKAASESMVGLFMLARRTDRHATLQDAQTRQNLDRQMNVYQTIATNTGKTVDEIIKSNADSAKRMANLVAAGGLDADVAKSLTAAHALFSQKGMSGLATLTEQLAQSGGNLTLWKANNTDEVSALQASGALDQVMRVMQAASNGTDQNQLMSMISGIQAATHNNITIAANQNDTISNVMGDAGLAAQLIATTNDQNLATTRGLGDWLDNIFLPSEGKMIAALGANTLAVSANTLAQSWGLVKGVFGKLVSLMGLFRGAGGVVASGSGMAATRAALTGGSAVAATGSTAAVRAALTSGAGMGLGKMLGKSFLKKLPIIGAIMGLGLGAGRMLHGDFTGGALEMAGGLASGLLPGIGTAASFGIDGILAARDAGAFGGDTIGASSIPHSSIVSPTHSSPNVTTNNGIRNDTQRMVMTTNQLLNRLVGLADDQLAAQKDIKQNTSASNIRTPPGFWDSVFGKTTDIAAHSPTG